MIFIFIITGFFSFIRTKEMLTTNACGHNRYNNNSPLTERIVGGNRSFLGEWPWQVSLQLNYPQDNRNKHWCGGVLMEKEWIVTAAHCILNPVFSMLRPNFWQVKVGDYDQKLPESSERLYGVSELYHYPWYKGYDNDIALIKLNESIEFNEYVSPLCFPEDSSVNFEDKHCISTGWGKLDTNKPLANMLQKVDIQVFPNKDCKNIYLTKFKINISDWHLCAGVKEGGKGTCHGDSGGPLQCKIGSKWYLAGITSFGSGCAKPGFPDVYTRVTHFLNWIEQIRSFSFQDKKTSREKIK